MVLIGTLGYLAGSMCGWYVGRRGGRELIARHGRWLHLGPDRFARAERWFARFGSAAVFLGRLTPLVRSFISIPAGVLGGRPASYAALTFAGSLVWCVGFASLGWALGDRWESVHQAFRYVDYAVVALVVAVLGYLTLRLHRTREAREGCRQAR
jgi:membrane protein DedA with SNARE-associated domain